MNQYYLHIVQIDYGLERKHYAEPNSYLLNLKCSSEKLRRIDYYYQADELASVKTHGQKEVFYKVLPIIPGAAGQEFEEFLHGIPAILGSIRGTNTILSHAADWY